MRAADDLGTAQRHRLRPQALAGAQIAARLQAGGLELRAQVATVLSSPGVAGARPAYASEASVLTPAAGEHALPAPPRTT
ncbi:hypothetical protein ATB53_11285 [Xanthomonas translucens]|uniref:Uncharacterized protein n=1 Tax=Xanthomonas campestris pv. translucens TaxID=343 RepID=A0A109HPB2_XANCT|nr:hypothetical protein ATB53_11285 [Xanthomonas translucens]